MDKIARFGSMCLSMFLSVSVSGCGQPNGTGPNTAALQSTPASGGFPAVNTVEYVSPRGKEPRVGDPAAPTRVSGGASVQQVSAQTGSDASRIHAGDVLEISVFQVDDLRRVTEVNAEGLIEFPLIGKVKAGGATISQLEGEIEQRLGANYLQNPDVTVVLKDAPSQRVTVDGAVSKPGIYPIRGKTSLLQTIAMAQGFAEVADVSDVTVFRVVGGKRTSKVYDVRAVRTGKAADPEIIAGDLVVAGQSAIRTAVRNWAPALGLAGRAVTMVP